MTDIIIQGICGRMGRVLAGLIAQREDCRVVAGIDPEPCELFNYPTYKTLDECNEHADVLIDFSHPDASYAALLYCACHSLACVICTTGLSEREMQAMTDAAKTTAVFFSANMSLGVNLLTELAKRAQAVLPGFDIEIIEKHHHNKLDAPSGTALALADAINAQAGGRYHYVYNRQSTRQKRNPDEIGIHALRGGSIVGEHDVLYAGNDEVLTLSHQAYSRDIFANGAVAAALYMHGKPPGHYSMADLMVEI